MQTHIAATRRVLRWLTFRYQDTFSDRSSCSLAAGGGAAPSAPTPGVVEEAACEVACATDAAAR